MSLERGIPYRYYGGVAFTLDGGAGIVCVHVSDEALDCCDRSRQTGGRLAVFRRHRYAIEQAACRKLDRNNRETDGSVLIRTVDLNG